MRKLKEGDKVITLDCTYAECPATLEQFHLGLSEHTVVIPLYQVGGMPTTKIASDGHTYNVHPQDLTLVNEPRTRLFYINSDPNRPHEWGDLSIFDKAIWHSRLYVFDSQSAELDNHQPRE